jgi:hypothetical protein
MPEFEADGEQPEADAAEYLAAILTRRRRKCIAEGAHPEEGDCPRCGL